VLPVNGSLRMAPLFPRSGPGESGSPMSQVLLRCYDFPPRISGHLFASLPGSTRSSSVRVSQLALPEGRRASGPGHLFNRRPNLPVCLHVDVSGTSQVPRRSIPCLCPALRPRPNRRSLASLTVASVLPPRFPRRRLQRFMNFGAQLRGFGTCCLRFKSDVATTPAKLASGRLAWPLPGGRRTLWIATKGFRSKSHPPFLDLSWRKGSFILNLPSHHSITSSARASSVGGTSRPSVLAVLRLMTNSNLVDCTTGRSAGLSPLRMRPAYTPA